MEDTASSLLGLRSSEAPYCPEMAIFAGSRGNADIAFPQIGLRSSETEPGNGKSPGIPQQQLIC